MAGGPNGKSIYQYPINEKLIQTNVQSALSAGQFELGGRVPRRRPCYHSATLPSKGAATPAITFITFPNLSLTDRNHVCRSVLSLGHTSFQQLQPCRSSTVLPLKQTKYKTMLSRLTRLTSMSSHIVGGLSHLWDDRTAPNQATAKGTHQELVGFGHDHGYYCVNSLSNSVSALTTNDDPFLGVPHRPDWNDARAEFDPLIGQIAGQPQEKIIDLRDLGGRLTPDDDLPWYEKFDITTNFLDNYSLEKTRSRNNSLNIDIGLPSAFGNNTDFSLLNECDWESPNFHSTFLNDSCLSTDPGNWPKVCETKEKGDWPKLCDQPIDDPLSEVSSQTSEYSRSTPSPLIEEEEDAKKSSEPEYTNTGRLKRQCRRLTVMDIMREACEESESGEPKRAKNVEAMTLGEYFESKDVTACLDKPKVRGVVIKVRSHISTQPDITSIVKGTHRTENDFPYVDAATFRRRVMNRESARKYRARKRREKYQAKSSLLDLEKRNVDLKVEVVGLEHEIAALKRQMNI